MLLINALTNWIITEFKHTGNLSSAKTFFSYDLNIRATLGRGWMKRVAREWISLRGWSSTGSWDFSSEGACTLGQPASGGQGRRASSSLRRESSPRDSHSSENQAGKSADSHKQSRLVTNWVSVRGILSLILDKGGNSAFGVTRCDYEIRALQEIKRVNFDL